MTIIRRTVDRSKFNPGARYYHNLREIDFESAMQDVYDFLFDINSHLFSRGLPRLEDTLRTANMSGTLSDMLTVSMAKHSRNLVVNRASNGHPDLLVGGVYPGDAVRSGEQGMEIKTDGLYSPKTVINRGSNPRLQCEVLLMALRLCGGLRRVYR